MSVLSINRNTLAANTANNLAGHYSRLAVSTQRLSSGLRINGAADDAAGLAIRELMRADISALEQGARNVNDAISMIQTFDGALSVIDEKLIRMKELAEQAATGTYDSTQRLMIDSEFQAMGEEIDRIARATDFNGIKLIDGVFEIRDTATGHSARTTDTITQNGKDYSVNVTGNSVCAQGGAVASQGNWDLSGITNPAALVGVNNISILNDGVIKFGDQFLLVTPTGQPFVPPGTSLEISYDPNQATSTPTYNTGWSITSPGNTTSIQMGTPNGCNFYLNGSQYSMNVSGPGGTSASVSGVTGPVHWTAPQDDTSFTSSVGTVTANLNGNILNMTIDLGNGNSISNSWNIANGNGLAVSEISINISVRDVTQGTTDPNTPTNPDNPLNPNYKIPDDIVRIHFGTGADKKEDFYDINKYDATRKGLGLDGVDIQTQDKAQEALVLVDEAIVAKDMIRAEYGAMQNRLENTLANITIQAENLQASESRISDADIAQEMTNFVRNQILTQSAVAMLTQANSLPQMVMRLIG